MDNEFYKFSSCICGDDQFMETFHFSRVSFTIDVRIFIIDLCTFASYEGWINSPIEKTFRSNACGFRFVWSILSLVSNNEWFNCAIFAIRRIIIKWTRTEWQNEKEKKNGILFYLYSIQWNTGSDEHDFYYFIDCFASVTTLNNNMNNNKKIETKYFKNYPLRHCYTLRGSWAENRSSNEYERRNKEKNKRKRRDNLLLLFHLAFHTIYCCSLPWRAFFFSISFGNYCLLPSRIIFFENVIQSTWTNEQEQKPRYG